MGIEVAEYSLHPPAAARLIREAAKRKRGTQGKKQKRRKSLGRKWKPLRKMGAAALYTFFKILLRSQIVSVEEGNERKVCVVSRAVAEE